MAAETAGNMPPAGSGRRAPLAARRDRATRRSVLIVDRLADYVITIGGMMVIVAVLAIMVFLAAVVVPLFTGAEILDRASYRIDAPRERPLFAEVDEYRTIAVLVGADGRLSAFHYGTGAPIAAPAFDFGGQTATAIGRPIKGIDVAFGFGDGTIRLGRLRLVSRVLAAGEMPAGLGRLDERDFSDGRAVYSLVPGGQVRKVEVEAELGQAQQIAEAGVPILAVDYRVGGTAERPVRAFVSLDQSGVKRLSLAESRQNLLTRKVTTTVSTTELKGLPPDLDLVGMLISERADRVYVAERSGRLFRFDTRDFTQPVLAEIADLMPGEAKLTALRFLIGEQSIVAGGTDGSVRVFFPVHKEGAGTTDGLALVEAHTLEPHGASVAGMSVSERGRTLVTLDNMGEVWLRHVTSGQTLLRLKGADASARWALVGLAPREDGILMVDSRGAATAWRVSAPHPETTFGTLFGKVWYEGYPEPSYTWQSSSGTDSFEPKFSLVPLIFGTVKATLYALLFAIPVALLGAIYTSEFVHPAVRGVIKPTMEMMASLPSVVLGFIAALILAPVVETWIAAVLLAFAVLPLLLLGSAAAWQFVPGRIARRFDGVPRLAVVCGVVALGFYLSYALGGTFERLFFAGDFMAWANGDAGGDVPFMTLLLLPLSTAIALAASGRVFGDAIGRRRRRLSERGMAAFDLARWLAVFALALALSLVLALLLDSVGVAVRGTVVGTYVQRNTFVVGFAMGFAVIPIIYTIAEDALNAVPEHLRSASLACGATPWQTALWVILPTGFSGIFAAIMIGMGRAVGETMIVVMAAGNTPLLDWNIFNGLRALSANIAVELPEAVKDGTLYRVLFLAALTLFVMTFAINTFAEIVRLRFRRRAAQL
ncbi:MAG: ABC transporter permease subunit [Proteobacteria bacterium]|nr:ABC transporter permease subunit [Pseudomonadota bacterium]